MHLALENSNYIHKMIVVDMGIKSYPMHHQDVVKAIQSVDIENVTARSQVHEMLKPMLQNEGLIQFLLKNLYWKEKGVLAWRMNTYVLIDRMAEVLSALPEEEVLNDTLFIRGALSNYILDEDIEAIEDQFPNCNVVTIENAGHWVHAESPEDFIQSVLSFLLR